jgi:hypothetical protein
MTLIATVCLWMGLVSAVPVQAHSVWLEPLSDGKLVLRFGEWGEKPETSPGHLDALIEPTASVQRDGASVAVELAKKADHYLLVDAKAAEVATGKSDYAVMQRGGGPGRRPIFYARWWPKDKPAVTAPAMVLDLVPTADKVGQVRVSFRG